MGNRDYDKLLKAGNAAQLEKLKENEHKQGWDDMNIDYAVDRIVEEVEELIRERDVQCIRREAADIANFCHMIILRCDRIIQLEKERG